ncbi:MAG: penicillin-binding protein 2 [Deltaproteobacteria bacterium]|nr:penicillin-binding protein 2 [Deltaproteobacteria bacterium]
MKSSLEPAFTEKRVNVFTALLGLFFIGLIVRLYVLQVVKGEEYQQKSQDNFVQERRIAHARGLIVDQAGRVLVDNRPSHDVTVTVAFLPDSTRTLGQLLFPLQLTKPEISERDKEILAAVESADEIVVADDVDGDACDEIEERRARYDVRGVVLEPLADGGCRVVVTARDFPSRAGVFRRLRDVTGLAPADMKARVDSAMQKAAGLGKFRPSVLLEDVGYVVYARIAAAASLGELPGIDVVDTQKRRYRNLSRAAHVLGYLNEISPEELKKHDEQAVGGTLKDDAPRYVLGDLLGRKGLESSYESVLRGKDGVERVVVDAKGRTKGKRWAEQLLGDQRITPPVAGSALVLSLDDEMQAAAEDAFQGVAGSVIAMEVDTGYILAMASFPAYDPNLVTGPWSKEIKRSLDLDKARPWTNKAIQDHYSPGSTFKAITASAGLRHKLITETSSRPCPGFFRLGSTMWRCYSRGGHGSIALVRALQYSCDSYFYSLGYDLGPDRLAETGRLFSFGSRTGIDIYGESPGIMPDKAYFVRRNGAYTPGNVVNISIGQGELTVTPLQLAVSYAALANGGKVMKPQLVREVRDAMGATVHAHEPVQVADINLDEHNLALMKEALAHVTDPGGTASGLMWKRDKFADMSKWLRESGVTIVGKTGTAQVVKLSKLVAHVKAEDMPYEQRDNAWFVGFAPLDKPEIVVVTMTEHGGFGGSASGPVTAEVLRTWFTKVRGKGRYSDLPALPPPKKIVTWVPKKVEEPTEESAHVPHDPEEVVPAPTETEGGIVP